MRPILALLIPIVVFGCIRAYTVFERSLPTPQVVTIAPEQAAGTFAVDLTLTFDAAPDDFALEPLSVLVQLQGEELFRSTEDYQAGASILLEDVGGIVEGANSFFVKVAPAESNFTAQRAVRVRVLRDGQPIAEQTLWSRPGEAVEGEVQIVVHKQTTSVPHEH